MPADGGETGKGNDEKGRRDRGVEKDEPDGVDKAGEHDSDECGAGGDNLSYYLIICKKNKCLDKNACNCSDK